MNTSLTFTVKIRTLVLAAVAVLAVIGISQTLIARNVAANNTAAAPVMFGNPNDGVGAVVMNGKVYGVYRGGSDGFIYKEAFKKD